MHAHTCLLLCNALLTAPKPPPYHLPTPQRMPRGRGHMHMIGGLSIMR